MSLACLCFWPRFIRGVATRAAPARPWWRGRRGSPRGTVWRCSRSGTSPLRKKFRWGWRLSGTRQSHEYITNGQQKPLNEENSGLTGLTFATNKMESALMLFVHEIDKHRPVSVLACLCENRAIRAHLTADHSSKIYGWELAELNTDFC